MTMRTRKFIGAIALFGLIAGYAFLALAVAVALEVRNAGRLAEFAYYVLAGLLWVLPAGLIISWMQKPDAESLTGRQPREHSD